MQLNSEFPWGTMWGVNLKGEFPNDYLHFEFKNMDGELFNIKMPISTAKTMIRETNKIIRSRDKTIIQKTSTQAPDFNG